MRRRQLLTGVWLASFVAALLVGELYLWHIVDVAGQRAPIASAASRLGIYEDVATVYGPIVAAIMAFWFARPFKSAPGDAQESFRYRLALGSALLFNIIIVAMFARYHFEQSGQLAESLSAAKKVGLVFAFLVAWPNYYYFGSRKPEGDA